MDAIVSTMNHLVSVSAFNKGAAGARNEPECVLISPKEYAKLIEEIEDLRDYRLATERLLENAGKAAIPVEDVLKEDGISQADLDAMEDVEFE